MLNWFHNLKIRGKLITVFLTIICLTVIVSVIALVSQYLAKITIEDLFEVDVKITQLTLESNSAFLTARQAEKDYFLYRKTIGFEEARKQYVNILETQVTTITTKMEEIRGKLEMDSNAIENLNNKIKFWDDIIQYVDWNDTLLDIATGRRDTLKQQLNDYQTSLADVKVIIQKANGYKSNFLFAVEKIEEQGNDDSGIEGDFRQKAHDIQTIVTEKNLNQLIIDMLTLRHYEKEYLLHKDREDVRNLQKTVEQFKHDVNATSLNAAEKAELIQLVDNYQDSFDRLVNIEREVVKSIEIYQGIVDRAGTLLLEIRDASIQEQIATQKLAEGLINTVGSVLLFTSVFVILLGVLLALRMASSISGRVVEVTELVTFIACHDIFELKKALQQLAEGDLSGDFSILAHPVKVKSEDEISQMAEAFNTMVREVHDAGEAFEQTMSNLRRLIGQVAINAEQVDRTSTQLADSVSQTRDAASQVTTSIYEIAVGITQQVTNTENATSMVEHVTRAIESIATGAQDQATSIHESLTITDEISHAIEQIANNAYVGADIVAEAASVAQASTETIDATIRSMKNIKEKVLLSAKSVREMGMRSQQIGSIVSTIDDIATQTNLLALNANIEAARAGEHGKGFAIVADEVRKLAEQSAQATQEITQLVQGIQQTVDDAVAAMQESTIEVETGVEQANDAGQALDLILQAVEMVNEQVQAIAEESSIISESSKGLLSAMHSLSAVVEENSAASQQMSANTTEVLYAIEDVARVSKEEGTFVKVVTVATTEMSNQVDEVSNSAQMLSEMAQTLQKLVDQFKFDKTDGGYDDYS
ncbi:MAG: hypothetical protein B6242_00210 [Anaerolineaceae bacterium 4572_78]|nr:MAG: hypothetical protein B6242_00210 [Anaerolineaceae bacterium 4572_78]